MPITLILKSTMQILIDDDKPLTKQADGVHYDPFKARVYNQHDNSIGKGMISQLSDSSIDFIITYE